MQLCWIFWKRFAWLHHCADLRKVYEGELHVLEFEDDCAIVFMQRGQNAAVFFIGYLFTGGYRLFHSMASAAVRPLVKTSDMGLAYSMVETGNALAMILAPLAAGFLYHAKLETVNTASLIALVVTVAFTVGWCLKSARR